MSADERSGPARRRRWGGDRGPRRVGELLDDTLSRLGGPSGDALARLFSEWEAIAGPSLSQHVRPLRMEGSVLVVAADQPAWATQVRSLSAHVLERVGAVTGLIPERLEVRLQRPPSASGTKPGRLD